MVVNQDLLQKMTDRIVEEVQPEAVILFGSHATGQADENSDVDLLVIESEPFGQGRSRLKEINRISSFTKNIN